MPHTSDAGAVALIEPRWLQCFRVNWPVQARRRKTLITVCARSVTPWRMPRSGLLPEPIVTGPGRLRPHPATRNCSLASTAATSTASPPTDSPSQSSYTKVHNRVLMPLLAPVRQHHHRCAPRYAPSTSTSTHGSPDAATTVGAPETLDQCQRPSDQGTASGLAGLAGLLHVVQRFHGFVDWSLGSSGGSGRGRRSRCPIGRARRRSAP